MDYPFGWQPISVLETVSLVINFVLCVHTCRKVFVTGRLVVNNLVLCVHISAVTDSDSAVGFIKYLDFCNDAFWFEYQTGALVLEVNKFVAEMFEPAVRLWDSTLRSYR